MKKLNILIFATCLGFFFIGCAKEPSAQIPNEKKNTVNAKIKNTVKFDNSFDVSIEADADTYEIHTSSISGITLTPKLEGVTDKNIEYQWTIDSDTEMFDTESGPRKKIINLGESVLFVPVAEIGYVAPDKFAKIIKVSLVTKEKNSHKVLTKTELIIEDYSGTYKVKK